MGWLKDLWDKDWDMSIRGTKGKWLPEISFEPSRPFEESVAEIRQHFNKVIVIKPNLFLWGGWIHAYNPKKEQDPTPTVATAEAEL